MCVRLGEAKRTRVYLNTQGSESAKTLPNPAQTNGKLRLDKSGDGSTSARPTAEG